MLQVKTTQCSLCQREGVTGQQGQDVDRTQGIALASDTVGPWPFAQQGHSDLGEGG